MNSRGADVYLVEDSPILRDLLTQLIETTGSTVIGHAGTASAAIADLATLHPDAITIDISLEAGNGFQVLEALAISHREGNMPLRIVLTNYVTDAYRNEAKQLGVDHFFDKAREIREVLTLLESLSKLKSDGLDTAIAA